MFNSFAIYHLEFHPLEKRRGASYFSLFLFPTNIGITALRWRGERGGQKGDTNCMARIVAEIIRLMLKVQNQKEYGTCVMVQCGSERGIILKHIERDRIN